MRAVLGLTLVLLAASVRADAPPYDAVVSVVTHNSYFVPRVRELGASGVGERLLDQLVADGARGVELDIHRDARRPGEWSVYHTNQPSNSLCASLTQCLEQLQLFHYLVPNHDVVNVVIELKEIWGHAFDATHTPADLDRLLRRSLGDSLYAPADLLARCPGATTLRRCLRQTGWPSHASLRGKLIVNLLGSWHLNAEDWVRYAAAPVGAQAAFAMRAVLHPHGLTRVFGFYTRQLIDEELRRHAEREAVFCQVEDLAAPELRDCLRDHGVVRSSSVATVAEAAARVRAGLQLIQTDWPWRLHALSADPSAHLLRLHDSRRRLATDASVGHWQTFPATSRGRMGQGCLRADGGNGDAVVICRQVATTEEPRVLVLTRHSDGTTTRQVFDDGAGDLVALELRPDHDQTCVVPLTASALHDGLPAWHSLGRACFVGTTTISLEAVGDVVFAGSRGLAPILAGR